MYIMLYYQLKTLPNIRVLRINESYHCVIFHLIKKCISYSNYMQSSQAKEESVLDVENFEKIKENPKMFAIYEKYIQHVHPRFRSKILNNYLSLNIDNSDLYLISRDIARQFVALIKDDLLKNTSHVIELNPGFGLLTENLLESGVPFVNLYEKNVEFYCELQTLSQKFANRIHIKKANLFKISKTLNKTSSDMLVVNTSNMSFNKMKRDWNDECYIQVIGATAKHDFLRHLIISTVFQTGFMMYGRPSFFMGVSPSIWSKYTNNKKGITSSYVMFNILFDYKIYGTVDRKAYVPWQRSKRTRIYQNLLLKDDSDLLVVKFEPKPNLFALFNEKKDLVHFWYFVRHHLYRSTQRVIPALEKIVPGCGVKFIQKNYTIYTEFRDLTYNEIYDLYIQLISFPEYHESLFLSNAKDIKMSYDLYMEEHEYESE